MGQAEALPPPIARAEVQLVRVPVVVRDENGAYRTDLTIDDFEVLEDGVAQTLKTASRGVDLPLTVALVFDASGSQAGFGRRQQSAADRFLAAVMKPGDRGMAAKFQAKTWLIQDLTEDRGQLEQALGRLGAKVSELTELTAPRWRRVGSGYYDAMAAVARGRLKAAAGRKAILMFTDGLDNASRVSLGEAIEAAQSADAIVYHLAIMPGLIKAGQRTMQRASRETGGMYFRPRNEKEWDEAFAQIEAELRNLYELSYAPSRAGDGSARKIEVKVKRPGWRVTHRPGYRSEAPVTSARE